MRRLGWLLTCFAFLAGCARSPAPKETVTAAKPPPVVKGFGLSPRGFPLDYSQLDAFAREVGGLRDAGVLFNGSWVDDPVQGSSAGQIPKGAQAVMDLSSRHRFTPMIVFGWRSGTSVHLPLSGGRQGTWSDPAAHAAFRQMLAEFAKKHKPPYLFLGNENDFYYAQNPADYGEWIKFYNSAYEIIKKESPETQVGPVFSYEHMAGNGTLNGWTTSHWGALESHDLTRVDIVGLTMYPWLSYASPADVPKEHLDALFARLGRKPVAITETGWPAAKLGGLNVPWSAGDKEQAAYIGKLPDLLAGKDVRIVNWLHLYPMRDHGGSSMSWKLFGSVSLYDDSGARRPAYDSWLKYAGTKN